jgi:hypothetical protein
VRALLKPWRILVLLVGVSAALRLQAAEAIPTPWIAPDELIYAELGRSLWHTGHLTLFGNPVGFYSALYPLLAGLPLSLADRAAGYELVKTLNSVVISLMAVPVYLWGRELVSRRWAIVAAAVTLAAPSLAYAGLIMTEVAFYPAFVLAAWAIARAVTTPTLRRQGVALGAVALVCAVRLQAAVMLAAYPTAVVFDASLHRDHRRLRAHAPAAVGLVALGLAWTVWQLRHGGPLAKVFGAYEAAGKTHYGLGDATQFALYHLGDVVLISGVVPFCTLLVLAWRAAHGQETDARVRAYVATTLSLVLWLAAEVGVFASRNVGHLAERNLFPLVPLLVLGLVVWLQRGSPRPPIAALAAALLAVSLLGEVPWEKFTTLAATPSAFTQIPLFELTSHVNLDAAVPLAAAVLLAACAVAPPRLLAVGIPALLLALGAAASVSAGRFIAHESRYVQALTLGPQKDWVDMNASGPVTFLYAQLNPETVWESRFWNSRITATDGFLGAQVNGMTVPSVAPRADGVVVDQQGKAVRTPYVLASPYFAFDGRQVATARGIVVLSRIKPPLRVRRWVHGVTFDGSVPTGFAELQVYACSGGTLRGVITAPERRGVVVFRNGHRHVTLYARPDPPRLFSIPVDVPKPAGKRLCTITLRSKGTFTVHDMSFP